MTLRNFDILCEHLKCFLCNEISDKFSVIPCNHSYCSACTTQLCSMVKRNQKCKCPECNEGFYPKDVSPNGARSELARRVLLLQNALNHVKERKAAAAAKKKLAESDLKKVECLPISTRSKSRLTYPGPKEKMIVADNKSPDPPKPRAKKYGKENSSPKDCPSASQKFEELLKETETKRTTGKKLFSGNNSVHLSDSEDLDSSFVEKKPLGSRLQQKRKIPSKDMSVDKPGESNEPKFFKEEDGGKSVLNKKPNITIEEDGKKLRGKSGGISLREHEVELSNSENTIISTDVKKPENDSLKLSCTEDMASNFVQEKPSGRSRRQKRKVSDFEVSKREVKEVIENFIAEDSVPMGNPLDENSFSNALQESQIIPHKSLEQSCLEEANVLKNRDPDSSNSDPNANVEPMAIDSDDYFIPDTSNTIKLKEVLNSSEFESHKGSDSGEKGNNSPESILSALHTESSVWGTLNTDNLVAIKDSQEKVHIEMDDFIPDTNNTIKQKGVLNSSEFESNKGSDSGEKGNDSTESIQSALRTESSAWGTLNTDNLVAIKDSQEKVHIEMDDFIPDTNNTIKFKGVLNFSEFKSNKGSDSGEKGNDSQEIIQSALRTESSVWGTLNTDNLVAIKDSQEKVHIEMDDFIPDTNTLKLKGVLNFSEFVSNKGSDSGEKGNDSSESILSALSNESSVEGTLNTDNLVAAKDSQEKVHIEMDDLIPDTNNTIKQKRMLHSSEFVSNKGSDSGEKGNDSSESILSALCNESSVEGTLNTDNLVAAKDSQEKVHIEMDDFIPDTNNTIKQKGMLHSSEFVSNKGSDSGEKGNGSPESILSALRNESSVKGTLNIDNVVAATRNTQEKVRIEMDLESTKRTPEMNSNCEVEEKAFPPETSAVVNMTGGAKVVLEWQETPDFTLVDIVMHHAGEPIIMQVRLRRKALTGDPQHLPKEKIFVNNIANTESHSEENVILPKAISLKSSSPSHENEPETTNTHFITGFGSEVKNSVTTEKSDSLINEGKRKTDSENECKVTVTSAAQAYSRESSFSPKVMASLVYEIEENSDVDKEHEIVDLVEEEENEMEQKGGNEEEVNKNILWDLENNVRKLTFEKSSPPIKENVVIPVENSPVRQGTGVTEEVDMFIPETPNSQVDDDVIWIMKTYIPSDVDLTIDRFLKTFTNVKVAEKFSLDVNYLVVGDYRETITVKYLLALAMGWVILHWEWMNDSLRESKVLPTSKYILKGAKEPMTTLFNNFIFLVQEPLSASVELLEVLLKVCGGTVYNREKFKSAKKQPGQLRLIVAFTDTEKVTEEYSEIGKKMEAPVVSLIYIAECVKHGEVRIVTPYVISSTSPEIHLIENGFPQHLVFNVIDDSPPL